MTTTFTINGNLITDEAAAVQNSGTDNDTGVGAGPDNEVAWLTLLNNMSAALKAELNALSLLPATGEAISRAAQDSPGRRIRREAHTWGRFRDSRH